MSEHEFDVYLSLLTRLLHLKPGQREAIADELRDHLEERLEELRRAGLSRDEAIRRALDDFGDAAGLAADFTRILTSRRRRTLMRLTLGTLAVMAAVVFVGLALWPDAPGQPAPGPIVAQQVQQESSRPARAPELPGYGSGYSSQPSTHEGLLRKEALTTSEEVAQRKLRKPLEGVSFSDIPLQDVLDYISEAAEVDIVVDRHLRDQLQEAGLELSAPVNLEIRHTNVPAAAALELALRQAGLGEVAGYTIRDGLVYITSKSQSNQIRVYNVRDLVTGAAWRTRRAPGDESYGGGEGGYGYGSMHEMPGGMSGKMYGGESGGYPMMGGMPGGMMAPGMGGGMGMAVDGTPLTQVIRSTVRPSTWAEAGGEAGLAEYNGLLIVKAGQEVHREIEQLLQLMRSSARGGPGEDDSATAIIPTQR